MKRYILLSLLLASLGLKAQTINHWETAVYADEDWRYYRGITAPPANWNTLAFNANSWQEGEGGIGFGDNDDETVVQSNIRSLYMRTTFNVVDTAVIKKAIFDIDYDDGFVAYLNGVEVARNNVGNPANYNTLAFGEHEAQMYGGGVPEGYSILKSVLTNCLVPGQNVLAIQVHNVQQNSDDLTCIPFLTFAITDSSTNYGGDTHDWFIAPFDFTSSELPIIVINTNGNNIVDDPRVMIDMGIIDNGPGQLNHPNDAFTGYTGKITIEYRGSSTQGFPKKQYGMSTVNADGTERNVSLLGLPEENDWILNAPYTDKTMMREYLTYNWARRMGHYATRTRYCELVVDGQYQGVYILLEKIKWDNNRVDVPMIDTNDNNGDSLTGGYIFKIDKFTGSGGSGWPSNVTDFQGQQKNIFFQYHYPKSEEITNPQAQFLQTYVNNFETNLNGSNFASPANGYHKFIDVQSFIDFFLLNEVTKNVDGYRLSTYLYKQAASRGGKLYAGPIWDFNITLGNADYCAGDTYTGWALDFPCDHSVIPFWWHRMQQDTTYVKQLVCRWTNLRTNILSTQTIMAEIDSLAGALDAPQQRNYAIWPILGTYVWPNNYVGQTYADEVAYFKQWLNARLEWMDNNIGLVGGTPIGTQECASVNAGTIVVSEVNYNSENSIDAGDWFELKNVTNQTINVSNWQFKDGSVNNTYTFPPNTNIPAGGYLVVYQDALLFNQQHPGVGNKIGPFNFGFGNSGDEIHIFDALSNPVFSMAFADSAGWANAADGIGYTLELIDPNGDFNSPANWVPGCVGGSPGTGYVPCSYPIVFSEINYNSSPTADAEDWVELHNTTNQPILLTNYVFLDENDTLAYTIPTNTTLAANGYLVLSKDTAMFHARFPQVSNMRGPFLFGLGGGGDALRLFDATGKLVVSVYYDDENDWPTEPDGTGYTLELSCATCNLSVGGNWFAGCPEGSPGGPYVTPCGVGVTEHNVMGAMVYPNPFTDRMVVQWNGTGTANTTVELFDMYGRMLSSNTLKTQGGINRFDAMDTANLPTGMYMVRLAVEGQGITTIRVVK